MTVAELMEKLAGMPQDSLVIMSGDGEGNRYSPLSGIDPEAVYQADSTWCGDVYPKDWSAEDACMEEDEWEEFKRDTPPCIVLYPTN